MSAAPPLDSPVARPDRPALLGMDRSEIAELLARMGEPAYRAGQIARWIYPQSARSFGEMTDLPSVLRERLAAEAVIGRGAIREQRRSRDGTVKILLGLTDGRAIETVLLPYADRTSVCISSQVGCPVGCTFCATATMGFARNLSAGEMVDQVLAAREFAPDREGPRITHVAVMGMGEPLLNLPATAKAVRLLRAELGTSPRHVTVSTAGFVPGIIQLAEERLPVTLALSLHAPNDHLRERLIPLGRKFRLDQVMEAVRFYAERTGRRVSLEYLLLGGVNDRREHARQLAALVRRQVSHVNLIPWNPAHSFDSFQPPVRQAVRVFRRELERQRVTVTERVERGQEIEAACGQLAARAADAP